MMRVNTWFNKDAFRWACMECNYNELGNKIPKFCPKCSAKLWSLE